MKLEDLPFDIPDNWMWIRQKNVCWLDNGEKEKGEKLPYLEAKVLRGKQNPTILSEGVIVTPKERVILVDGENSGEIMAPTSYNGCDRYQQHVPDLFIPIQSLPPPRACRARLSLVSPRIPRRRPPLLYRPTL